MSDSDMYRFIVDGENVVGVQEYEHGRWEIEDIDRDERYVVDGNDVVKTEMEDGRLEVTRYTDTDGDGIFIEQKSSSENESGYDSDERYDDDSYRNDDTYRYDADNDDDIHNYWLDNTRLLSTNTDDHRIMLSDGEKFSGHTGEDDFVVTKAGNVEIVNFDVSEGDRLVFDTGRGLSSRDDLARFLKAITVDHDSIDVNFGELGTVSLIGISPLDLSWSMVDIIS